MSSAFPRLRKLRLRRKSSAIDGFRLEASIGTQRVKAIWNGRHLELSDQLHQVAEMAVAVDDIFVDSGLTPPQNRSTLDRCPEAVMLTLINCCDTVQVAEYSSEGRRRLLSP